MWWKSRFLANKHYLFHFLSSGLLVYFLILPQFNIHKLFAHNFYTMSWQASRKKWRVLLEHCCKTGGDAEVDRTGGFGWIQIPYVHISTWVTTRQGSSPFVSFSFAGCSARYNIGVEYGHHVSAMAAAGVSREAESQNFLFTQEQATETPLFPVHTREFYWPSIYPQ
jgi:hypothetical protein